MQKYFLQYLVALVLATILLLSSHAWYEVVAVSVFFFMVYKFVSDLGSDISIKNIFALICTMQWLLGPVLGYAYNDYINSDYQMHLPKETFFSYVLPATLLQLVGLYLPYGRRPKNLDFKNYPVDCYKKGRFLILLGFLGDMTSLGFVSFILGGLKFVGLFYMFASTHPYRKYWLAMVFGSIFITSIGQAMFHDLLLWGSFFLMMFFWANRKSIVVRFSIILAGFFFIMLLQLIKGDYRATIRVGNTSATSNVTTFTTMITEKITGVESIFSPENFAQSITRINQGWIVDRVIEHVPINEPYAKGSTIWNAVVASIFPRFLMPDKGIAGGRNNMLLYAGVQLNSNTSMDISQVGEAYANFGVIGGVIFMFLYGLFLNWILYFLQKRSVRYPDLIFWVPLIFLQVVKAETSFMTVLNHLTKTALVTWFFFSSYGDQLFNVWFTRKRADTPMMPWIFEDTNKNKEDTTPATKPE